MPLCINHITVRNNLKKIAPISSGSAEHIVRHSRKELAHCSVLALQAQARKLENTRLLEMISDRFIAEKYSMPLIPMFWTYKVLVETSRNLEIPILFYAKFLNKNFEILGTKVLFFTLINNGNKKEYQEVIPSEEQLKLPAICIEGTLCCDEYSLGFIEEWKEKIKRDNIEVILAGSASHRQYPEDEDNYRIKELCDSEYERYENLAESEGYSLSNPTTFLIQHVFSIVPHLYFPMVRPDF